jgi:hypothetical protein
MMVATERQRHVYQAELERMFAGVTRPEEMGTTGLVGWTLAGPGGMKRDWNRCRKAVSVVRRRHCHPKATEGFGRAVLALIHNRSQRERFARYFASLLGAGFDASV